MGFGAVAITSALGLVLAGAPQAAPPADEPAAVAPTEPPATEPPATEPPATEPPASEPPATEPPATEPPATEPPATEPPKVEPPATEPPKVEPPPPRPVEPTPKTMPGRSPGARAGFIVAGSILLAGSLALAGTMGFYIARSRELEREGERKVGDDPSGTQAMDLQHLVEDGQRANHNAIWTGVAAGVALSAAIGLLVSGARRPKSTVTPALSRGGAGLVWSVRF